MSDKNPRFEDDDLFEPRPVQPGEPTAPAAPEDDSVSPDAD